MIGLVSAALRKEAELVIPAGALAQAWRSPSQVHLARLVAGSTTESLDKASARACGEICARSQTADVIDAQVALCALRREQAVIATSDAQDIAVLAPGVRIAAL